MELLIEWMSLPAVLLAAVVAATACLQPVLIATDVSASPPFPQVVELDDDAMMAYLDVSRAVDSGPPVSALFFCFVALDAPAAPAPACTATEMVAATRENASSDCSQPAQPTSGWGSRRLLLLSNPSSPIPVLQGELPDETTIRRLLRKGTIEGKFVPMCCGTAFKNKGVQPLLDAVVDYLPAPTDLADVKGSAVDDPEKVRAMFGWLVGIDWAGFSTACPPPPTWPTSRALLWMTRRR